MYRKGRNRNEAHRTSSFDSNVEYSLGAKEKNSNKVPSAQSSSRKEQAYRSEGASPKDVGSLASSFHALRLTPNQILDDREEDVEVHHRWQLVLNEHWNPTRPNAVDPHLDSAFETSSHPYETALFLTVTSPDFYQTKANSLSFCILKHFKSWKARNEKRLSAVVLSDGFKYLAFEFLLKQKSYPLMETGFHVFRLAEKPELFVTNINHLVLEKKYKEACWLITHLGIQNHFSYKEIVVPLIFQDKLNLAEKYLDSYPPAQKDLVCYLDSLCCRDVVFQNIIDEYKIPNVDRQKCQPRIFRKLAARLMKKYNIPLELCPNICQSQNIGALKYLLYKKYTEGNIDEENFDDLLKSTVGNDPFLQKELISSFVCYNDIPSAARYAMEFGIRVESLPNKVQYALENNLHRYQEHESSYEENWDAACEYHEFPLPLSHIILVQNPNQFSQFLDKIKNETIIGIDAEWKMTIGIGQKEKIAIIQIATWESVFIIDVVELLLCLTDASWQEFARVVFYNPKMLKLGFAVHGDLRMIARTLPCTESLTSKTEQLLDISLLCDKIYTKHPSIFLFDNPTGGKKLSDWVQMCLGLPLDKGKQLSNWEKRPLKPSQLIYAALDSYCLIEIYDVLMKQARKQGINLDTFISKSMISSKEKKQKQSPSDAQKRKTNVFEMEQPTTSQYQFKHPAELAVVVDTMLQGLGRQLRMCGVDVKILENYNGHEEAVKIAMRESRIILTSGSPYMKLSQYVPEGMCYNVTQGNPKAQVAEVLKHFGVSVSTSDIFSRCQVG